MGDHAGHTQVIDTDYLLTVLRRLVAAPSGATRPDELATTARLIADLCEQAGMQTRLLPSAGAPLVVATLEGRTPARLLCYHHYDLPAPGAWRVWHHEPFQLAERDDLLYGRGVAQGKAPLAALLAAIKAVRDSGETLPWGVVLVAEGERLLGSASLLQTVESQPGLLRADACLAVAGECNVQGVPLVYLGSKGLLRVRLEANGSDYPLAPGFAASVANPLWRLTWALNHIKGEDEDIRITGFYDDISGAAVVSRQQLKQAHLDVGGRLAAWGVPHFLSEMQDTALVRAEATLPTCNVADLRVATASDVDALPVAASATLDFQLVPDQQPDAVLQQITQHLAAKGFEDVQIKTLTPGYAATVSDDDTPFLHTVRAAVAAFSKSAPSVLPLGTFALPLAAFVARRRIPTAVVGLARSSSALYGANEFMPRADLAAHSSMVLQVLLTLGHAAASVAVPAPATVPNAPV